MLFVTPGREAANIRRAKNPARAWGAGPVSETALVRKGSRDGGH